MIWLLVVKSLDPYQISNTTLQFEDPFLRRNFDSKKICWKHHNGFWTLTAEENKLFKN